MLAGLLGAAAAGLLVWAGARLFDRRTGLVAGALLAVAFLPVHYGHLALNDVPALAPACLALVGVAGVYRSGRHVDYAIAGIGIGLACATKYTAGIVAVCLLGAAAVHGRRALTGLVLAGALALLAFLVANPYALLDAGEFRAGLQKQSDAAADGGGKLGLVGESGILYYLSTTTWGLGWLPAFAALGGAIGLVVRRSPQALILVPGPILFLLFMGTQDRFFARWLLPIYPMLCLLAAWAAVAAATALAGRVRPAWRGAAWPAAVAGLLLCAQGLVFSVHNDLVLSRDDTRALARQWLVDNVPAGDRVVVEPIAPNQWAMDAEGPSDATGTGNRWNKWPTSRFQGRPVKLEDYERTLRTSLLDRYEAAGYCHVVTGSTQFGRALVEPRRGAGGDRLLRRARAPQRRRPPRQPARGRRARRRLLVRLLVQRLPAVVRAAGPRGRYPPVAGRRVLTRQSICSW